MDAKNAPQGVNIASEFTGAMTQNRRSVSLFALAPDLHVERNESFNLSTGEWQLTVRSIVLASVAVLGLASAASATPLVAGSQISLAGYVQAIGSVSIGAATGLDFVSGAFGGASVGSQGTVANYGSGTGSFAGISCDGGACGSIQDIPSLTVGAESIAGFLSLGDDTSVAPLVFDLATITEIARLASGTVTFIANGTIRYGAFDPTAGSFSFSAQGNEIVSFFATVASGSGLAVTTIGSAFVPAAAPSVLSAPVPEPASVLLLGFGTAVLAAFRSKRGRAG